MSALLIEDLETPVARRNLDILYVAVVVAIVAHLLALFVLEMPKEETSIPPAISVTLLPKLVLPPQLTAPVTPAAPDVPETPVQTQPPPIVREEAPDPVITSKSGAELYRQAIESAKTDFLTSTPTRTITFSVADFPKRETEPVDAGLLPKLIQAPSVTEIRDAQGIYRMKVVTRSGKVRCIQQISSPGDGNPPLWYLIPADMCGHM